MDKFAEIDKLAASFTKLSKKERKKLKREIEREEEKKKGKQTNIVKWMVIALLLVLLGVGGWFLYRELSKPLPGEQVADLGRDHVARDKWETFEYNSNPPTSGPHDETWVKAGVYEQQQLEGMLIHSLEHGYVVLHYNCNLESSKFPSARAQGEGKVQSSKLATESGRKEEATQSVEASSSGDLPPKLSSQECDELKKKLSDLANDKKLWKLIVVPRQNLDARIALTAWTRIDKIDSFQRDHIVAFIDAHRNKGPEQTME